MFSISLFASPTLVSANVDPETWEYLFHLEYKEGKLSTDPLLKPSDLYDSIPEDYTPEFSPAETDFYGNVISGKGKELARFGFNKPTTMIPSLGKSLMNVFGPYFANADRVAFYERSGKHLFDISVRGSSFCNDNNKCETNVGENNHYCPNDCPLPAGTTPPAPAPIPVPAPTPEIVSPPSPTVSPPGPIDITPPNPSSSNDAPSTTPQGGQQISTMRVIAFTIGILTLLLGTMLWLRRKKSAE